MRFENVKLFLLFKDRGHSVAYLIFFFCKKKIWTRFGDLEAQQAPQAHPPARKRPCCTPQSWQGCRHGAGWPSGTLGLHQWCGRCRAPTKPPEAGRGGLPVARPDDRRSSELPPAPNRMRLPMPTLSLYMDMNVQSAHCRGCGSQRAPGAVHRCDGGRPGPGERARAAQLSPPRGCSHRGIAGSGSRATRRGVRQICGHRHCVGLGVASGRCAGHRCENPKILDFL